MNFIGKLFLSLVLFLAISCSASANLLQVNLSGTMLDASNQTTNDSSAASPNLVGSNAYIMKTSLAAVPNGHSIVSARLYLYSTRSFQTNLNVYGMVRDFTVSQATWNIASTGLNWGTAGATNTSTDYNLTPTSIWAQQNGTYAEVDVTAQAQAALAGGSGNLELMLRSVTNGAGCNLGGSTSTNPPYIIIITAPTGTANTWYIRDGGAAFGSDTSHCNGTVNTLFTGSNGPNCALNNPTPVIAGSGVVSALWRGGDTVSIAGDSDNSYAFTVPSGVVNRPAVGDTYTNNAITYTVTVTFPAGLTGGTISMSGAGAPTASGTLVNATCAGTCDATITYTSKVAAQAIYKTTTTYTIPGGADIGHQTRILGTGTRYAQIWGSNVGNLISASNSYIDLNHLDLTSHDSCIAGGPIGPTGVQVNPDGYLYVCNIGGSSTKSTNGIFWGGTGLTMENLLVHNFAQGMNNSVTNAFVKDITMFNVKVFGNSSQGALLGSGATTLSITGTISLLYSMVDFNGCGQRYPLQDSADLENDVSQTGFSKSIDNEANYYNCFGQGQNGYGDGYGYGSNNGGLVGNWTIIGSSVSFNSSDNVDTLHGSPNGTTIVARSRFEGAAGQLLKLEAKTLIIENNALNGDCGRWVGAPESSTTQGYLNQHYQFSVSGITTWPWNYTFTVSGVTVDPAIGDQYTNNGHTYTVVTTIAGASGNILMSGNGTPSCSSGSGCPSTLTRSSGSGDASITFSNETQTTQSTHYTINGVSYTVLDANQSGSSGSIYVSGLVWPAVPPSSGSGTRTSGVGDSTINYSSYTALDAKFEYSSICRAGGDLVALPVFAGSTFYLYNNTINSNSITIEPTNGSSCDATTQMNIYNNIVNCGGRAASDGIFMDGGPSGNEQLGTYIYFDGTSGNGGGPCGGPSSSGGLITLNRGNNLVYNCKNNNSFCSPTNNDKCQVSPGYTSTYTTGTVSVTNGTTAVAGSGTTWTNSMVGEVIGFGNNDQASITTWYVVQSVNSPTSITLASNYTGSTISGSVYVISIPMGTPTGPASYYYHGTDMISWLGLSSGSQARASGNTSLTFTEGTKDFNNFPQTTPIPDLGAFAFGSSFQPLTQNGGSCTVNGDCVSNFCVGGICSGCLSNGTATGNPAQCCSGLAAGGQCVSCYPNGIASPLATQCCSGFVSGGQCVPYVCGDAIITSPEICDTNGPKLNGQTCATQGFVSGTLACSSGCLSLDTSSCTNSCGNVGNSCANLTQCCSGYCYAGQCATNTGDLATGIQGWWKMDDGSGTTTVDSSGNGYTGTLVGPPSWVAGRIGPFALSFSGATQYANIANQTNLNPHSITISGWINSSATASARRAIAGKWFSGGTWGYALETWDAACSPTGGIAFVYRDVNSTSDQCVQSGIVPTVGTWYFVVGQYDATTGKASIYVNNVLAATHSDTSSGNLQAPASPFGIGAENDSGTWNYFFKGTIDDVRVYNRVLTLSDLNTLYTYGCNSNSTSCGTGNTCCSSFCSSNQCVPYICGDGLVVSPEVCDGGNLNHQTCITQGFNGGSLSCNSSCLSFNTSACTGGTSTSIGAALKGDFGTRGQCVFK